MPWAQELPFAKIARSAYTEQTATTGRHALFATGGRRVSFSGDALESGPSAGVASHATGRSTASSPLPTIVFTAQNDLSRMLRERCGHQMRGPVCGWAATQRIYRPVLACPSLLTPFCNFGC
jgi:hypothetical protein